MRRNGRGQTWGWAAICVGSVILLGLVLPTWFWWLACGILLVLGGVWLLRC